MRNELNKEQLGKVNLKITQFENYRLRKEIGCNTLQAN